MMRSTGGRGVTVVTLVTLVFAPVFNGHQWYDRLVGKTTTVQTITCAPADPCPPTRHEVQQVTLPAGEIAVGFTIQPGSLPAGHVGFAYSATLTAPDAAQPVTFTTDGDTLPPGITLSAGGVIAGTPSAGGSFSFVVQGVDALGDIASRTVHVTVGAGTPHRSAAPSTLAFGAQGIGGDPVSRTVTISSDGTAALGIGTPTVTGPFTVSSGCPASLAAGADCSIEVRYVPAAPGADTGTLTVPTEAGDVVSPLAGSGYERVAASAGGGMFIAGGRQVRVEWAYRVATNRPVVKGKQLVVRWGTHVFVGTAASSLTLAGTSATVQVAGTLDGVAGASVTLVSTDSAEPGAGADSVSVAVTPPAGSAAGSGLDASGVLVSGNVGNRLI